MKILVSSKALALKLSEIDFDRDSVQSVSLAGLIPGPVELRIGTQTKAVKIYVESIEWSGMINQRQRNWRWVARLLGSVEEQPVVLEISESIINVIFQY